MDDGFLHPDDLFVDLNERLDVVLSYMAEHHIGCAAVTRHGKLAGMFTTSDACSSFAEFLREQIMPLAGIEEADLDLREAVRELQHEMRYVGIEAARKYVDGDWTREETTDWLLRYALLPAERIEHWFAFVDRYRAYVINYVVGYDLATEYVRRQNPDGDAEGDWQALAGLLSLPPTPLLVAD